MQRPNLLMIVCDQLRYDSVGFSGPNAALGAPVPTPHLDALAADGLWFEDAYTAMPPCCPARQSMLAGCRPERFGALWNYDITSRVASLTPEYPTWSAALHDAGYRMGHVGKWHVSPTFTPLDFGYDDYVSEEDYLAWRQRNYPDAAGAKDLFGGVDPLPLTASHTHWLAARAVEHLRRYAADARPWHLRLDLSEPHPPCMPCAAFAERFSAQALSPWPSFGDDFAAKPYIQRQQLYNWGNEALTWQDWRAYVARYFAIVSQLDDAVGLLLDALRDSGAADNTVILFTADHGDMCGSHRMIDKHYVLYDDVVHVPLVLAAPGVQPRRVQGFVNNCLDMAPTLTQLAGLPPMAGDGRSLAGLLTGQAVELDDCALTTLNGQQFGLYTQRMLRTRDWKYIWNLTDTDELYDLQNDPWELHNLVHDPAAAPTLARLRQQLYGLLQQQEPNLVHNDGIRRQLLAGHKL